MPARRASTRETFDDPRAFGQAGAFPLGKTYATPGALALGINLSSYLRRHHCGDWGGGLCADDKAANEHSLKDGTRLLSCYHVGGEPGPAVMLREFRWVF